MTGPAESRRRAPKPGARPMLLVVSYAEGGDDGIHVYRFDTASGALERVFAIPAANPSYLVASRDGRHVYAVNELPGGGASPGIATVTGMVSAYAFDATSGTLTLLDRVSSHGQDPCHLSLSSDGRHLALANYSVAADPGGSVTVLPVAADGRFGAGAANVRLKGSGPVSGRQDSAHAHSVVFAPDGRHLFALDLGADRILRWRFQGEAPDKPAQLVDPVWLQVRPGSGPRHLRFGPEGRFAYVMNELDASIDVYRHHDGLLSLAQHVPMTEPGFGGGVAGSALHFSPDRRFLYASNRGDADEILVYAVDRASGMLKEAGRQSCLGRTPREFAIDPGGGWLIVGNQGSDALRVFRRDQESGRLDPEPGKVTIGRPAGFAFVSSG